ncbi:UDP-glucosyltransferase family protein [Medicago truncatula]|uniref:Glycosyltransferase n=1 Tax=Medicago truncatula TaxID=3880 RepID=A0A072V065_MEDTR|nr:UDP-glucosyltransferase family protein [Medicago truncatula]
MSVADEKTNINILMVSMALQGHVNPMLNFAKRLISKGVNVTIATTEDGRDRMLKHIDKNSSDSGIKLEFFSDGLSVDFDRSDTKTLVKTIQEKGSKNLSDLITNLTKNETFSCAIVNPFVPWAIDVVAEHEIPCALLWIQASALYSIYYHYFNVTDSFPSLEDLNEKVQLPGLPILEVRDLPSMILPSSPLHFKEMMDDLYKRLNNVKWVLGASFFEIEEEIVKSMDSLTPIYPIGPLVSPFLLGEKEISNVSVDMWNAEDACIGWLDNKPNSSVIYISFGSLVVLSQTQMNNIVTALKNSNKNFLWVVKPANNGGYETKDAAYELPKEFLKETEGRGLVVKWCAQEKVLMHPAVACFLSHCGWNSTLETLITGVPVIGWPSWTDQPTNAMLIQNVFRNGVKVKYGEDGVASVEEIERCIREVLEGPHAGEIKKRATEIKELARKTLQEGGSSSKNFNKFISELVVKNDPRVVQETSISLPGNWFLRTIQGWCRKPQTKSTTVLITPPVGDTNSEVKGDSEFILNKFVAQEDHRRFDRKRNFADI